MGTVVMPVAPAAAPPISFADVEAAWTAYPFIGYAGIARLYDVSVTDVMEAIDAHLEEHPAPPDPN